MSECNVKQLIVQLKVLKRFFNVRMVIFETF